MCRNRPFSASAGKAQSTPPKGTSRQVSKRVGAPFKKTESRQDPFVRPGACRAHFGRGVFDGPRGLVAWRWAAVERSVFGSWTLPAGLGEGSVSRPCWIALRSVSSLRPSCSATSLRLRPAPSNCWAWAVTSGVITEAPRVARGVKNARHASGAIRVDAANDAVLRDAEGPHDIHLAAHALADQLGGKHPKTSGGRSRRVETPAERRRSRSIGHFRARH